MINELNNLPSPLAKMYIIVVITMIDKITATENLKNQPKNYVIWHETTTNLFKKLSKSFQTK